MTSTLITDIGELVTNDPGLGPGRDGAELGIVTDAAIVLAEGRVAWVGPAARAPAADVRIEHRHRAVLPGFVDSHTHLVFAGDRAAEFEARMTGARYDGGGIASTVRATRAATDADLRDHLLHLLDQMQAQGTTTAEIKSGYGLTVADEARALDLAAAVTSEVTFLGAHVVPPEFAGRADDYVDLVTSRMLRECAPRAKWVDVFCEPASPHAFDADQSRAVLEAGIAAGLQPRIHANQLSAGPGVQLAVELGCASADHCTHLSDADVAALAGGETVATLLPTIEWSTRSPYPDARRLLDAGVTVALATDCNPGSGYSSSMPLAVALAVREMGMSIAEGLWAATAGGARALRRDDIGHLGVGALAHLAMLDAPSYRHLAYRVGVPLASGLVLS
ncbi:MAG: imidazolonepropionase [Actinomycetales bacterium]